MAYAEAAFFDGNHCQHLADREEHHRRVRIQRQASSIARAIGSISRSEGPATAWLRSNSGAIDQIRRDRLADAAARINGGAL